MNVINKSQETIAKRKATILKKREAKHKKTQLNKQIHKDPNFKEDKQLLKSTLKHLTKYNVEVKTLPIKYKQNNVMAIYCQSHTGETFDSIREQALNISKKLRDEGLAGSIGISLKFDFGWQPAIFRNFGELKMYNPTDSDFEYDQDEFHEFEMYIVETPKPKGGNSENNNCLYYCLKDILQDNIAWADGLQLKKFLNLKFKDKVPITMIPQIEAKQRVKINVTGDYVYISTFQSQRVINLILQDEHYSLDMNNSSNIVKPFKICFKEKKPIIYDVKTEQAFDGTKQYTMNKIELNNHKRHETDYIVVTKSDDKTKTLQEEYNEFISDANMLKEKSNEVINLYKTGDTKITALHLFDKMTRHINPTHAKQAESEWIQLSTVGALIFSKQFEGKTWEYDVKSQYPSIQKSGLLFPVEEGEFMKLTDLPSDYFKYGIYRVVIHRSDDENTNKLFRFNYENYYPHFDLNSAKLLGLKMELIHDGQPNFLYYERSKCLTGNEIFGPYVSLLFELKNSGVKKAKAILNILWGALCEKKLVKKFIGDDDEEYIIKDSQVLHKIIRISDNKYYIKTHHNTKVFKTPFARIMPFILSKARLNMTTIMKPYKDIIVKCHTDGFKCKSEPKGIKLGSNIGDLEFEGNFNRSFKTSQ